MPKMVTSMHAPLWRHYQIRCSVPDTFHTYHTHHVTHMPIRAGRAGHRGVWLLRPQLVFESLRRFNHITRLIASYISHTAAISRDQARRCCCRPPSPDCDGAPSVLAARHSNVLNWHNISYDWHAPVPPLSSPVTCVLMTSLHVFTPHSTPLATWLWTCTPASTTAPGLCTCMHRTRHMLRPLARQ